MTHVPTHTPEQRPRLREARDEREPGPGTVVPWETGRMFAQLLSSDTEGSGYGSSAPGALASSDALMIEAMTGQLVPRLQAQAHWPLHAVIHLPRLGRINARVEREQSGWSVELEAEEERTARWLSGVRQRCQDELTRALRQPVDLHLVHVDPA